MTMLTLEAVTARYASGGGLTNLSLSGEAGEVIALVGPNGAGKSMLLRIAAGLQAVESGEVRVAGQPLAGFTDRQRARQIAFLAADQNLAWPLQSERLVALGRTPYLQPLRAMGDEDQAAITGAMVRCDVETFASRRVDSLSSGERARVHLARVLATQAPVVLLDEPIAALDLRHQIRVMEIVRQAASQGALVIMAIHALELAARYADRVVVLDEGVMQADGPPAEAFQPDILARVFGVRIEGGLAASSAQLID